MCARRRIQRRSYDPFLVKSKISLSPPPSPGSWSRDPEGCPPPFCPREGSSCVPPTQGTLHTTACVSFLLLVLYTHSLSLSFHSFAHGLFVSVAPPATKWVPRLLSLLLVSPSLLSFRLCSALQSVSFLLSSFSPCGAGGVRTRERAIKREEDSRGTREREGVEEEEGRQHGKKSDKPGGRNRNFFLCSPFVTSRVECQAGNSVGSFPVLLRAEVDWSGLERSEVKSPTQPSQLCDTRDRVRWLRIEGVDENMRRQAPTNRPILSVSVSYDYERTQHF